MENKMAVTQQRDTYPGSLPGFLPGLLASLALLLAGCGAGPSALDPQGPGAARIADLWWLLLGLGGAVFIVVMAFLMYALFHRRREGHADNSMQNGSRIVLYAGIISPAVILIVVFGFTVATLNAISTPDIPEEYTVHVIGRQWWWEVRYPHHQIETANEIHIPAGQPVRIVLSSDDVIHSFWVPELHGKLDLVPGMTNEFWLQADQPGVYLGECAEFCGIQHAKMRFLVIAEPREEFAAWAEAQRQPAAQPSDSLALRGQTVFMNSTCLYCHTVNGTQATGDLGPDLTHLASRRTLAAASVPNNPGNLGGWIADPQHLKPGNLMPPTKLTGSDLQALLAYLATLE
jgi:cytochrome c oxidase subunit II